MSQRYGETYGTSEMYAAGIASTMGGGDHFSNSMNDQNDSYELNSAAAMAAVASGAPSDLLMGLSSTVTAGDIHALAAPSNLTKEQLNAQQEAIRAHPLYPFLTVLFERCELATSTPRDNNKDTNCRQETAAEMFKEDLMAFVKSRQDDKMRLYVADPELDKLMLNAIQVLRLHLLELEKVHELCDHFCQRYVNTLKDQMQMDMMHEERSSSAATNNASPVSPNAGPSSATPHPQQYQQPVYEPQIVNLPENMHPSQMLHSQQSSETSNNYDHIQQSQLNPTTSSVPTPGSTNDSHTPNGSHLTHLHQQQQDIKYASSVSTSSMESPRNSNSRNGSTANNLQQSMLHDDNADDNLSINGSLHDEGRESPASDTSANGIHNNLNSSGEHQSHPTATNQRSTSSSSSSNGKRKVPKVFPKDAITKFRAWLFQNLQHPYPSEEQKKQLAQETNLTILQVNNWFINARRRIVQPMIDSNNRAGRSPHCGAFRNRRRRNDDHSPAGSPSPRDDDANATSTTSTSSASVTLANNYSPDNSGNPASMMNVMAASAAGQYPMFPAPYGFPTPGFPSFMPNMVGAAYGMNPSQMPSGWMDFGGGSMDN